MFIDFSNSMEFVVGLQDTKKHGNNSDALLAAVKRGVPNYLEFIDFEVDPVSIRFVMLGPHIGNKRWHFNFVLHLCEDLTRFVEDEPIHLPAVIDVDSVVTYRPFGIIENCTIYECTANIRSDALS